MKIKLICSVIFLMLISGCAFTPQAIKVSPQLKISGVMQGKGNGVTVSVNDERPSTSLGQRGASGQGADLTIEGDLSSLIKSSLDDGFMQQGFKSVALDDSHASRFKVEIRSLDYKVLTGFWSGTIRSELGLKGICTGENNRAYEKFYRGSFEKSIQVIATDDENNQYISAAVSDTINQILNDQELGKCLSGV